MQEYAVTEIAKSLNEYIVEYGPWVISAIALIQVWIINLVRWLRRPTVEMLPSGNIEIGFSGFGPTIGLLGTLHVRHKDVFIKRMAVVITCVKDSSKHEFNWHAFRSRTINLNPSELPPVEVASSFLLTTQNPFIFNIFFVDNAFTAEVSPKVGEVPKKWNGFKDHRLQELQATGNIFTLLRDKITDEALYNEFVKTRSTTEEYTTLDRSFYWKAGEYVLVISVETLRPDKTISKTFRFDLSPDEERLLRLNSISIIRTLCGLPVNFFFAYPVYKA